MAETGIAYKGKRITVRIDGDKQTLLIDGQEVEASKDASGQFSSLRFPYTRFNRLEELGKAIIDNYGA